MTTYDKFIHTQKMVIKSVYSQYFKVSTKPPSNIKKPLNFETASTWTSVLITLNPCL